MLSLSLKYVSENYLIMGIYGIPTIEVIGKLFLQKEAILEEEAMEAQATLVLFKLAASSYPLLRLYLSSS